MSNRFSALQPQSFDEEIFETLEVNQTESNVATEAVTAPKKEPVAVATPKPSPVEAPVISGTQKAGNAQQKILDAKQKLHRKMLDELYRKKKN